MACKIYIDITDKNVINSVIKKNITKIMPLRVLASAAFLAKSSSLLFGLNIGFILSIWRSSSIFFFSDCSDIRQKISRLLNDRVIPATPPTINGGISPTKIDSIDT
jgi:hypothetical protein